MDCHFLFQGIFLAQGSNPQLVHCTSVLHCWWILYCWATREVSLLLIWSYQAFKRTVFLGIVAEEQVRDLKHQHVSLSHCWLTTRRDHEKRNLNLWLEAEKDLQPSGSRKTRFAFYNHKEVNSANKQELFVSRFSPENPRGKSLANTLLWFQSCYSKHNGKLDIRLTSEKWGVINQDYSSQRELQKPYITKVKVKVAQSCPTLCDPMDSPWNTLGQNTRVGSLSLLQSQPRDWTQVSWIAGRFYTSWSTREVKLRFNLITVSAFPVRNCLISPS